MRDGITATGSSSASRTNVSRLLVLHRLLPLDKHGATVNAQTPKLAFAVSAIKVDMEENVILFQNVTAKTLSTPAPTHRKRLATLHLPQQGNWYLDELVV